MFRKIVNSFFLFLGIVFVLVGSGMGIFSFVNQRDFHQHGASTTGEIYAIHGERVTVRFATNDGTEIIAPVNYWSSNMWVGQRTNILYMPDNPYRFSTDLFPGFWFAMAFGGIGLLFTAIGAVPIFYTLSKKRMYRWCRANGTQVRANMLNITEDRCLMYLIMRKTVTARLVAEYNGIRFYSDYVTPTDTYLMEPDGGVDVYIDPNNPKRYYVDVQSSFRRGGQSSFDRRPS